MARPITLVAVSPLLILLLVSAPGGQPAPNVAVIEVKGMVCSA